MFCIKCGEKINENDKFCMKCGEKIKNNIQIEDDISNNNINQRLSKMKNNKQNNKKSNRTLIIVSSIIGGILLIGIVVFIVLWMFVFGDNKVKDELEWQSETEMKQEKNIEEKKEKVKSDTTISFYKYKGGDYVTAINSNDSNDTIDNSLYDFIGNYECYDDNCSYKAIEGMKSVIYDNEYILYDIEKEKSETLNLNVDNKSTINIISYEDQIYGLSVEEGEHYAYYDLNSKKYVTEFIYDGFNYDASVKVGQVIGYIYSGDDYNYVSNYYVIDIKTGNIIYEKDSYGYFITREYNGYVYYLGSSEDVLMYGPSEVYNSDFELLLENAEIGILSNGNFMINNDKNGFSIYDSKGNLIKESKEYDEVKLVVDDYVAVIDSGYLKLVDSNENEVAIFTKWNNNMTFHTLISGYYKDNTTKVYGVYLVVEDNSIEEGIKGRGKEYYYGTKTGETGVIELEYIGGYAKPVLYLYPEEITNVKVTFEKPNMLTTTYPKYKKSWSVTAYPNGDLYDQNGRYYYGLYWEEFKNHDIDFSEGFYVTGENAINFLEEKLSIIGFTEREANEFIMYWLPILENNEKSLVYFELTDEREAYNKLNIEPTPDSLLRVAIHVKKVDSEVSVKEQKLATFNRRGFSAIEWGGVIH